MGQRPRPGRQFALEPIDPEGVDKDPEPRWFCASYRYSSRCHS